MKLLTSCLLVATILFTFPVMSADPQLESLLNFKEVRQVAIEQGQVDRFEYFRSVASSIGLQAGSYFAANEYKSKFESDASLLNKTYDFNRLGLVRMYKGVYIVNPVLIEIEKTYSVSPDARAFTVIDQTFVIDKDPYLSLTIPSWRDYLLVDVEPVQVPDGLMLPKTVAEIEVWKKSMLEGYRDGMAQVENLTISRIASLTSDILGMERYKLARQRNLISDVKLDEYYYPVSGGGHQLNIAETRLSIEVNPALNSNRWDWKPLPKLTDVSDLFPAGSEMKRWPRRSN